MKTESPSSWLSHAMPPTHRPSPLLPRAHPCNNFIPSALIHASSTPIWVSVRWHKGIFFFSFFFKKNSDKDSQISLSLSLSHMRAHTHTQLISEPGDNRVPLMDSCVLAVLSLIYMCHWVQTYTFIVSVCFLYLTVSDPMFLNAARTHTHGPDLIQQSF